MAKNTYGTGSFVLLNVGDELPPPAEGMLTTVAWTLDGDGTVAYALEGAIFSTGSAIQWLRDGLGIIGESAEVGPLAASVEDTGGVFVVPAFTGLGSPWWDAYARGTVTGITRGTTRAHLARAVVESMAYQTRDAVEAMVAASGRPVTELRVDGGASVMDLLLQIQADQLGVPVLRATERETTAVGAAYLAALAEGVADLDALDRALAARRHVHARPRSHGRRRRPRHVAPGRSSARGPGRRPRAGDQAAATNDGVSAPSSSPASVTVISPRRRLWNGRRSICSAVASRTTTSSSSEVLAT